ncbi:hypothetical protein ABMC88_16255 [Sulfitobacter sp. HNIBRBA2951]|uniref:hypothetical protein n=1 Tax=Sulfitobacter aquimarinus TaxID=3158557 RepID=UPI0032E054A5
MNLFYQELGLRGVLVTVLALLLLPIYTDGVFDIWDFFIGAVGIWFGYSCLRRRKSLPNPEIILASLIVSFSLAIVVGVFNDGGFLYSFEILTGGVPEGFGDWQRTLKTQRLVMFSAALGGLLIYMITKFFPTTRFDVVEES